jgi:hypothetical protein
MCRNVGCSLLGKMLPRQGRVPGRESRGCDLVQRKEVAEGVGFDLVALPSKRNAINRLVLG